MQTNPKQALKNLDLLIDTMNGLVAVLRSTLVARGVPMLTIVSPASTAEQREQFRQTGKNQYPYGAIFLTNVGRNRADTPYQGSLRQAGINRPLDNGTYINYKLIPVALSLTFKYNTQDYADVLHFANNWLFAEKESQFMLRSESMTLNVQNKFSEDIAIPELNFLEQANLFTVETSLVCYSYIADYGVHPKITKLAPQMQLGVNSNSGNADYGVTTTEIFPILPKKGL